MQTHKMMKLSQSEAGYTAVSTTEGAACSGCRWFCGEDGCTLVDSYPLPIAPNGYCNRYEAMPVMEDKPHEVVIVEPPESEDEGEMQYHDHDHTPPDDGFIAPSLNTAHGLASGLSVYKARDGRRLMLMVTSNAYRDRENERVLSAALKDYTDALWTTDNKHFMGDTQAHYIWHAKELGSVSDLLYADVWDGFLVEVWHEKPTALAKAFYNFVETHPEIIHGASHGFKYLRREKNNGEYKAIAKFESSTLPLNAAANLLTFSGVIGMKRDEYFQKLFKEQMGIDVDPSDLQGNLANLKAKLDAAGVAQKDAAPTHDSETVNGLLKMVGQMAEDIGGLVEEWEAEKAAKAKVATSTALTDKLDALITDVSAIKANLALAPRAAHEADETTIRDEKLSNQIKQVLTPVKTTNWAGFEIVEANGNGS